jgi:hypothetical protein
VAKVLAFGPNGGRIVLEVGTTQKVLISGLGVFLEEAEPEVIINQIQGANLGADLFNGALQ